MPDLSARYTGPELMDDLQASGADLDCALSELDTINHLLGGNQVTMQAIDLLFAGIKADRHLHIADLGCGSGDMLRKLSRKLSRVRIAFTGIDANPHVIAYAQSRTHESYPIDYKCVNVMSADFSRMRFDVVIGTLFFHHFTDEELIKLFDLLRRNVSFAVIINDIHRHALAFHAIRWLTKLLSRSTMVKHDAPVSVMRAFRRSELERILVNAGFREFSIRWRWAFRWQVVARTRQ